MDIQKVLIPNNICKETAMYFNGNGFISEGNKLVIDAGGNADTDTYFNSFSIKKWKQYTMLEQLSLTLDIEGKCNIYLCYVWIDKDNIIRRRGDNIVFYKKETSDRERMHFEFKPCEEGVLAYYRIMAEEKTILHYGSYSCKEVPLNDIKIGIGICTYKREEYIERNLKAICDNIIYNPSSPLYNRLDVFISDNGQSLDTKSLNEKHVKCFYNSNLGGSGGFTRCIMEVKKAAQKEGYTHVLLMDDDILLDTNAIERTYTVLTLLKPQYKEAMIGGAMLILNDMTRQFENGALYYGGMLRFENKNIDLRPVRNVIKNEQPHDINYNAWCYCCMPLSKIAENNLPMPFFIHMDDVEYGVRNKFDIITINGINVWHPFYANQRGPSIVYYDIRNKLITISELGGMHIQDYARAWLDTFYRSIFNYDYQRTQVACKAILDYCKGIDWFKKTDPLQLNKELSRFNPEWHDATEEIRNSIDNSKSIPYVSQKELIINFFLPSKVKRVVMDCSIDRAFPYRCKELIIYNKITDKYCIYKKSLFQMLKSKRACNKAKRAIKRQILDSSWEWQARINEITNWDFWTKYLNI